jgi:hypothetical protein
VAIVSATNTAVTLKFAAEVTVISAFVLDEAPVQ